MRPLCLFELWVLKTWLKTAFSLERNILTAGRKMASKVFPLCQQSLISWGKAFSYHQWTFFQTESHMGGDAAGKKDKKKTPVKHRSKQTLVKHLLMNPDDMLLRKLQYMEYFTPTTKLMFYFQQYTPTCADPSVPAVAQ